MHDVLIAGGGPAGLAAAIRCAQLGLRCAVIEPKAAPIDKACGEGLMPGALAALERLGVDELDGADIQGIRYLDAKDRSCSAVGDFGRPGRGVRRTELHQKMWARVDELGVEQFEGRVDAVEQQDDFVDAGGRRARYLIAADGLHSKIRRGLGVECEPKRALRFGVRRHFRIAPWTDRVEVHWSQAGEAYVTPVGAQTVGVAFLTAGGGRFDELLPRFPLLAARLSSAPLVSEARGGGPFEQRVSRRQVGRALLVGDAAGYLDPLTGEGVALGIATAVAAVESIATGAPDAYEQRYREITRAYYWLTGALLEVACRPWGRRPMIRLLDAVPWLFDRCLSLQSQSAGHSCCFAAATPESFLEDLSA